MDLATLPREILDKILQTLPLADLREGRLVSKLWQQSSERSLFRKIFIQCSGLFQFTQQVTAVISFMHRDKDYLSIEAISVLTIGRGFTRDEWFDFSWIEPLQRLLSEEQSFKSITLSFCFPVWNTLAKTGNLLTVQSHAQKLTLFFLPLSATPCVSFKSFDALRLPSGLEELEIWGIDDKGNEPLEFLERFPSTIHTLAIPLDLWQNDSLRKKNAQIRTLRFNHIAKAYTAKLFERPVTDLDFQGIKRMEITQTLLDLDTWHVYKSTRISHVNLSSLKDLVDLRICASFLLPRPTSARVLLARLPVGLEYLKLEDCEEIIAANRGSPSAMDPIIGLLNDPKFKANVHLEWNEVPPWKLMVLGLLKLVKIAPANQPVITLKRFPTQMMTGDCRHKLWGGICTRECLNPELVVGQIIPLGDPRAYENHPAQEAWMKMYPGTGFPSNNAPGLPRLPSKGWLTSDANRSEYEAALQWYNSGASPDFFAAS